MKKIIILFFITLGLGVVFSSCSSNEPVNPSMSSVEGKWNFSKTTTSINGVTSAEMDYDDNEAGCPKDYLEFKTGGVCTDGDYFDSACTLDITTGTWVQIGSTITVTLDGDIFSAEVVSVSSSVLKLKISETGGGISIIANITLTKA